MAWLETAGDPGRTRCDCMLGRFRMAIDGKFSYACDDTEQPDLVYVYRPGIVL